MNPSHIEVLQSLSLVPKPEDPPKKKRGRPAGSKNRPKEAPESNGTQPNGRKRGRPLGSKNKPKAPVDECITAYGDDNKFKK